MENALKFYHLFGARIVGSLSVPKTYATIQNGKLVDEKLNGALKLKVHLFEDILYGRAEEKKKSKCF